MAVNLAGPQIVTQILTTEVCGRLDDSNSSMVSSPPFVFLSQITNQAAGANCVFPENSSPACVDGQQNCGFTCNAGFTPSYNPPACVCAPPNILCNGQCQAGLCPSAQALKKKRWAGSVSCSERGPGWAACGVYGGGPRAWECVNTARDLESCTCTLRVFVAVIQADRILFTCSPVLLNKKVVAALFRSRLTLLSARTALRFPASQTLHVCMANAPSTAVSQDTNPRPTAVVASANTPNLTMRMTYPQTPTDSNTFPSGGTERSSKNCLSFPRCPCNPFYNY